MLHWKSTLQTVLTCAVVSAAAWAQGPVTEDATCFLVDPPFDETWPLHLVTDAERFTPMLKTPKGWTHGEKPWSLGLVAGMANHTYGSKNTFIRGKPEATPAARTAYSLQLTAPTYRKGRIRVGGSTLITASPEASESQIETAGYVEGNVVMWATRAMMKSDIWYTRVTLYAADSSSPAPEGLVGGEIGAQLGDLEEDEFQFNAGIGYCKAERRANLFLRTLGYFDLPQNIRIVPQVANQSATASLSVNARSGRFIAGFGVLGIFPGDLMYSVYPRNGQRYEFVPENDGLFLANIHAGWNDFLPRSPVDIALDVSGTQMLHNKDYYAAAGEVRKYYQLPSTVVIQEVEEPNGPPIKSEYTGFQLTLRVRVPLSGSRPPK